MHVPRHFGIQLSPLRITKLIPFSPPTCSVLCASQIGVAYLDSLDKRRESIPPVDSKMATLNTSTNGPSISKSYQSIINSPSPSGSGSKSPTYAQWAVFSVSAPLVNAFQQDAGGKESVLKVQSTGGKFSMNWNYSLLMLPLRGRAS